MSASECEESWRFDYTMVVNDVNKTEIFRQIANGLYRQIWIIFFSLIFILARSAKLLSRSLSIHHKFFLQSFLTHTESQDVTKPLNSFFHCLPRIDFNTIHSESIKSARLFLWSSISLLSFLFFLSKIYCHFNWLVSLFFSVKINLSL